jgi:hypothetical protein
MRFDFRGERRRFRFAARIIHNYREAVMREPLSYRASDSAGRRLQWSSS